MNRYLAILPLLGMLAGVAGRPDEVRGQETGPIALRLGGTPGLVLPYRHEKRMSFQLPEGLGGEATTHTILRLGQTIESRGVDSIVTSSEIREFQFDVDPRPEQLPDLSALTGMRFQSTATLSGRIYRIEIEGAVGPIDKATRDQVETWLRELGFPALPPGPVRIGQSWTDSARVPLSSLLGLQGEAIEVRTTTLEAVQQTPRESIARFSVETTWADAGEGPVPDAHVQGASTQTVLFDIRKGVFLNSRGTSRILVEVGSGTGAPPLTIEAEGSYETRLLEADD